MAQRMMSNEIRHFKSRLVPCAYFSYIEVACWLRIWLVKKACNVRMEFWNLCAVKTMLTVAKQYAKH